MAEGQRLDRVRSLAGGIDAWSEQVDPEVPATADTSLTADPVPWGQPTCNKTNTQQRNQEVV